MKAFLLLSLISIHFFVGAQTATLLPGTIAPAISLLNVDNKMVSFNDYSTAKGFIVIFTCNTCPYSKAYEQRMIALNTTFAAKGFPVIAINPNDPESSPGDSFEKMKQHAISSHFNFPYLFDKGQVVTALYGVKSTPLIFVINKTPNGNIIEYAGAIDNDTQNTDPNKTKWAEDAVIALLNNQKPSVTTTKAIGCRVSWKKQTDK